MGCADHVARTHRAWLLLPHPFCCPPLNVPFPARRAIALAPWAPLLWLRRADALLSRGWPADALWALHDADACLALLHQQPNLNRQPPLPPPSAARRTAPGSTGGGGGVVVYVWRAHLTRAQALRALGQPQSALAALQVSEAPAALPSCSWRLRRRQRISACGPPVRTTHDSQPRVACMGAGAGAGVRLRVGRAAGVFPLPPARVTLCSSAVGMESRMHMCVCMCLTFTFLCVCVWDFSSVWTLRRGWSPTTGRIRCRESPRGVPGSRSVCCCCDGGNAGGAGAAGVAAAAGGRAAAPVGRVGAAAGGPAGTREGGRCLPRGGRGGRRRRRGGGAGGPARRGAEGCLRFCDVERRGGDAGVRGSGVRGGRRRRGSGACGPAQRGARRAGVERTSLDACVSGGSARRLQTGLRRLQTATADGDCRRGCGAEREECFALTAL